MKAKDQEPSVGSISPRSQSPRDFSKVSKEEEKKQNNYDFGYKEQQQLWELTDGCLYLLREISQTQPERQDVVVKYLSKLPEIGFLDHFK